jgi:hypothetical protein
MVGLTVHAGSRSEWHGCFCPPNILVEEHAMPKATVMAMALVPTMLLAAHLDARVTAAQTFVATASVQNSCGSLNHSTGDHLSRWTPMMSVRRQLPR